MYAKGTCLRLPILISMAPVASSRRWQWQLGGQPRVLARRAAARIGFKSYDYPNLRAFHMTQDQDTLKRQAAEQALSYVHSGMALGLGSGSTAKFLLYGLA